MNTDISIRPAHLGGVEAPGAFADHIGFFTPPRINMLGDVFTPRDENGEPVLAPDQYGKTSRPTLQVIMLWENDTRIYYPLDDQGRSTFDPDSPVPPSCYSDDRIAPSPNAMQQQNDICATCPRAVRDLPSFDQKTKVSACKDKYKVACLVAGAKAKVFLLDVGPASRRGYAQYRNFLKQHHALPNQVITRLDYADKAFLFSFEAWIDERTGEMVKQISSTDEPAMIVNAFSTARQTALPGPAVKPQPAPVQPQVTAQSEPEPVAPSQGEQTVLEAPRRRRGRPPNEAPSAPPPVSFAGPDTAMQSANVQTREGVVTGVTVGPAAKPFLHDPTTINHNPAPQQARNNGGGFGMEPAEKPPVDIQEALNRAFGA